MNPSFGPVSALWTSRAPRRSRKLAPGCPVTPDPKRPLPSVPPEIAQSPAPPRSRLGPAPQPTSGSFPHFHRCPQKEKEAKRKRRLLRESYPEIIPGVVPYSWLRPGPFLVESDIRDALVEMEEAAVELKDLREREWREVRAWMKDRDDHPAIGQITGFPKLHSDEVSRLEARAFRSLLITASGALDLSAELVSIFVPSPPLDLRTGRSQFREIFGLLKKGPPREPLISSVTETMLAQLYARLRPLLGLEDGPEKDWYGFFMCPRSPESAGF